MSPHPSLLQLDRLALGEKDAALALHAETCPRCRRHLARLEMPVPIPAWLSTVSAPPPRGLAWLRLHRLVGISALATAAALGWMLVPRAPSLEQGSKGAPRVGVYLKRGSRVSLWDGRSKVAAGDSLRLKASAPGFSRLAVASIGGGGITELYAGPLEERGETLLPPSWTLDAAAGPERLLVVFSRVPLSQAELRIAAAQEPHNTDLWTIRLQLDKQGADR